MGHDSRRIEQAYIGGEPARTASPLAASGRTWSATEFGCGRLGGRPRHRSTS